MNHISKEIKRLLNQKINASEIARILKEIGDGDMQKGLQVLASYFEANGIKIGGKKGFVAGSVTVLGSVTIGGVVYLVNKCKKNKKLKADGEKIYEALKDAVTEEDETYEDIE